MSKRTRGNLTLYPCGQCQQNCLTKCILCDVCQTWQHFKCSGLRSDDIKLLANSRMQFVCITCRNDACGSFSFLKSLTRLLRVSSGKRKEKARQELLLLQEDLTVSATYEFQNKNYVKDKVAEAILRKCGKLNDIRAVNVSGDGNCLFNCLAMAVDGTEERSVEMRWRCAIELILNEHFYADDHNAKFFNFVSPTYEEACFEALSNHTFSSVWMLQSAATILQKPIQSIYPTINGLLHKTANILSTTLMPRAIERKKSSKALVFIMWSRFGDKGLHLKTWLPNHFVMLVRDTLTIFVDCSLDDKFVVEDTQTGICEDDNLLPQNSSIKTARQAVSRRNCFASNLGTNADDHVKNSLSKTKKHSFKQEEENMAKLNQKKEDKKSDDDDIKINEFNDDVIVSTGNSSDDSLPPLSKRIKHAQKTTDSFKKNLPVSIIANRTKQEENSDCSSRFVDCSSDESLPNILPRKRYWKTVEKPIENVNTNNVENETSSENFFELPQDRLFTFSDEENTANRKVKHILSDNICDEKLPTGLLKKKNNAATTKEKNVDECHNDDIQCGERINSTLTDISKIDDDEKLNCSREPEAEPIHYLGGTLKNKCFLKTDQAISILQSCTVKDAYSEIPKGQKENVYFIVNNICNKSKTVEQRNTFFDDCGVWKWDRGTVLTVYYQNIAEGIYRSVLKKGSKYCIYHHDKGSSKSRFLPLNPQPNEDELICIKRYYTTLKANPCSKRRITWLNNAADVALVESCGTFEGPTLPHGNFSATPNACSPNFLRTNPQVLERIRTLKSENTDTIVDDICAKFGDDAFRDQKVIANTK